MNSSSELDVTGSSAGSATVVGDTQGTAYPVVTPAVPMTLGLAVGVDGLLGSTTDEAMDTADMSGPAVGHTEEVAMTGSAPIAAIQRIGGKGQMRKWIQQRLTLLQFTRHLVS